jgi:ribulose bisphosphate carboxylase small subunit
MLIKINRYTHFALYVRIINIDTMKKKAIVKKQVYLSRENHEKVKDIAEKTCMTFTGAMNHLLNKTKTV